MLSRRALSTSARQLSSQLVKTPIQVHGIEGRYAGALYSAAHKQKSLDAVDRDLKQVHELYTNNAKFREFVLNPTLKASKKKEALTAVLQKLGAAKETTNFLQLLAENGRLNKLEPAIVSFESIMRAHRGEVSVQVTTAEPLSKKNESALLDALNGFAKSGQKLSISYSVNPSIVGGIIVNVGDKYVDLSIASKIKKYKETIESAI